VRLTPPPGAPWWHTEFFRVASAPTIDLARAAWILAAHRSALVNEPQDIDHGLADLDALATRRPATLEGWRRLLFVDLALSGNGIEYHDVRNSFLPDVLTRRVGIPISLAVLGIEIGRRMGIDLDGIGMPGHFLLGHRSAHGTRYLDPFNGGSEMHEQELVGRFQSMFGDEQQFHPSYLAPSSPTQILIRMLANLKQNYARSRDLQGLRDVLRLRSCLPGVPIIEVRELIRLHHAFGNIDESLRVIADAERADPESADVLDLERARVLASFN
jgi:Transglutaminase-like superfamily